MPQSSIEIFSTDVAFFESSDHWSIGKYFLNFIWVNAIQGQLDPLPFDAIIPFIEEEWNDEEYAYGEHYDTIYSKLATHAAQLPRQLLGCRDPCVYQQIESELAEIEAKLCELSLKFEASTEDPE